MSSLCCQVQDTTWQLSPNLEHNRHNREHEHFRMLTASLLHTYNLPESFYQSFCSQINKMAMSIEIHAGVKNALAVRKIF